MPVVREREECEEEEQDAESCGHLAVEPVFALVVEHVVRANGVRERREFKIEDGPVQTVIADFSQREQEIIKPSSLRSGSELIHMRTQTGAQYSVAEMRMAIKVE